MSHFRPPPVTREIQEWAKSIYAAHVWAHAIAARKGAVDRLARAREKQSRYSLPDSKKDIVEWTLIIRLCEQMTAKPKHYRSQAKRIFKATEWHYGDAFINEVPVTFSFRPTKGSSMGHARDNKITLAKVREPHSLDSFLFWLRHIEQVIAHECVHVAQYGLSTHEAPIGYPSPKIRNCARIDREGDKRPVNLHGIFWDDKVRYHRSIRHCLRDIEFWANFQDLKASLREMLSKAPVQYRNAMFLFFCATGGPLMDLDRDVAARLKKATEYYVCTDKMIPLVRDNAGKWRRYVKALAVDCVDLLD